MIFLFILIVLLFYFIITDYASELENFYEKFIFVLLNLFSGIFVYFTLTLELF